MKAHHFYRICSGLPLIQACQPRDGVTQHKPSCMMTTGVIAYTRHELLSQSQRTCFLTMPAQAASHHASMQECSPSMQVQHHTYAGEQAQGNVLTQVQAGNCEDKAQACTLHSRSILRNNAGGDQHSHSCRQQRRKGLETTHNSRKRNVEPRACQHWGQHHL